MKKAICPVCGKELTIKGVRVKCPKCRGFKRKKKEKNKESGGKKNA